MAVGLTSPPLEPMCAQTLAALHVPAQRHRVDRGRHIRRGRQDDLFWFERWRRRLVERSDDGERDSQRPLRLTAEVAEA